MTETQITPELTSTAPALITDFKAKNDYLKQINQAWRRPEAEAVEELLAFSKLPEAEEQQIHTLAHSLSKHLRERKSASGKAGIVQGLLQEFSLSSQEGIALMCLAEALLRIPDAATRDLLIRDKINQGNWKEHVGQSSLMFVNAAAWGLMLTGKIMQTQNQRSLSSVLTGLLARSGRGIIRKAVDVAMRMMGEQFVTGETIEEALVHAKSLEQKGFRYSYDMLGEAAFTEADADRYMNDYISAIHAIGQSSKGQGVYNGAGISIKLSAIHPRYQRAQYDRVYAELYPRILELARLAKQYDIGLNIDAEETDRLELSLELLERLCFEPELANWKGIGFVIQAYQKRCFFVADYVVDLAKRSQRRLMIRLVKGAYWDSEIKKAQTDGMSDYPVYTRKIHTDLSYVACAKKLLAAPEFIYPQFATHNAQSLATIYYMADPEKYYPGQYEFQCLHGMGEPLYEQVVGNKNNGQLGVPCRIYAPVGSHETLLAYLVRRLLENGANTSFVNRIADQNLQIDDLIQSPMQELLKQEQQGQEIGLKHAAIPYPRNLYGLGRINSKGFDLANDSSLNQLNDVAEKFASFQWHAESLIATPVNSANSAAIALRNPALHADVVGHVIEATAAQAEQALALAHAQQDEWQNTPIALRAQALEKAADLLEARLLEMMVLLSRESGKTYANAIAEVREAVDFLRYYAKQGQSFPQKGQLNALGTVLCISPWNFPLAIFMGQIAAALVTGNCVIAKPAEQTPLIAYQAVQMLHEAGIPTAALQFLAGKGETIGAQLSQDARIHGIMFTGSTEVAKILQKTVAKRLNPNGQPVTLIAETGGQNAMIVDSSALTEQVVADVINSAFDSAGQRCSALRILCVQQDSAAAVLEMLKGAMQQLRVGNPVRLNTDIGPVIDQEAQQNIQAHINKMQQKGYPVHQHMFDQKNTDLNPGTFIAPTMIELPNLDDLEREVFGPVLHVITYAYGQLDALMQQINAKGYGLTMGLHTRIDETIQTVVDSAHVGNLYINRNIVGAVVGVQPFGGEGLSGTGPKAGGPLYLYRLMQQGASAAMQGPFAVKSVLVKQPKETLENFEQLKVWAKQHFPQVDLDKPQPFMVNQSFELQGPTGESNQYIILPRSRVLSIADNHEQQLQQLLAIFAVNSQAVVTGNDTFYQTYKDRLPAQIKAAIHVCTDLVQGDYEAVLHHGSTQALEALQHTMTERKGAIVGITHLENAQSIIPLERLVIERAISINTAAAGGNASLMTMSD
ncbi:trifunctional transcriptional regulator/proline dehydrogenase/L-glutamate gamma-semialdehyde dehydrogenase [Acinetobacter sp. MD2(2019)]|uniref:trifunctional transcriptional regulator/proline dehydrogenase/L-glutamate gamma-semialdehyde dehydrogenase n=1 Tax=Acinetobacter sp. MD2(2019) TaxID=2605273 RepID=UPI002D1E585B|nr:trifunctional transcriptional regulator/proline dehydrogenase/L-glutamate gamma-semialdehyde dehydrogenase [Acinetobacter sp. MD2(2019)]MEB3752974.1 trifunctional transcriptional regulator/proline dehydrogenase/L-glutamate gamma-semialdehyde dehydrogenase [Acinetobacter sp. MD2(2019)]